MNTEQIRKFCLALPDVTEKLQWGDALCFKIREKMFAVLGLDQVRLTFKTTPDTFAELTEREDITPSPYLGRHNWVMLHRLDALPTTQIKDLLQASYKIVLEKAPKKRLAPKPKLSKREEQRQEAKPEAAKAKSEKRKAKSQKPKAKSQKPKKLKEPKSQ